MAAVVLRQVEAAAAARRGEHRGRRLGRAALANGLTTRARRPTRDVWFDSRLLLRPPSRGGNRERSRGEAPSRRVTSPDVRSHTPRFLSTVHRPRRNPRRTILHSSSSRRSEKRPRLASDETMTRDAMRHTHTHALWRASTSRPRLCVTRATRLARMAHTRSLAHVDVATSHLQEERTNNDRESHDATTREFATHNTSRTSTSRSQL